MAVQVVAYGHARTKPAHMPMAPAVSVQRALDQVGLSLDQIKTIKNHSPFIVNDLYLAKALGLDAETFNNYGTSLVFGHPQGPTLARLLIEPSKRPPSRVVAMPGDWLRRRRLCGGADRQGGVKRFR